MRTLFAGFALTASCLAAMSCAATAGSMGPAFTGATTPFIENRGQIQGAAHYYAVGQGTAAYFEPHSVLMDHAPDGTGAPGVRLRVSFPASGGRALLEAGEPLPARVNVLRGTDPKHWVLAAPTCSEVRYRGIAPGADLVYRVTDGRLKYDLLLAPGADLSRARLRYSGAERLEVAADGSLEVHTAAGILSEAPPFLYQEMAGIRVPVQGGYRVFSANVLGFWAQDYRTDLPLVVDPSLAWSTFMGGTGADCVYGMSSDGSGNIYLTGNSVSTDYPTIPGSYQMVKAGGTDMVVSKLRADGGALLWSTYLGGSGTENGRGITVDSGGNVYVCGESNSSNFPTTAGAFRTQNTLTGTYDAVVVKLNSNGGSLAFSTYLGGSNDDYPRAIAVDGSGYVTVAGFTASTDFATTPGVVKSTRSTSIFDASDGFVTKFAANGGSLVYSTYLGSSSSSEGLFALALDGSGRATVAGWTSSGDYPTTAGAHSRTFGGVRDGIVTRLNTQANGYMFSTFLGGSAWDEVDGVTVDAAGNTYVAGRTASSNFPTTGGVFQPTYAGASNYYDAFVTKIGSTGTLGFSTFVGGTGTDYANAIALSPTGSICVSGVTTSTNFPTTTSGFARNFGGGVTDGFCLALNSTGTGLAYSTYLGSSGQDLITGVAIGAGGSVVAGGYTDGSNYPTTAGAYDRVYSGSSGTDGMVSAIDMGLGQGQTGVEDLVASGVLVGAPSPNPFRGRTSLALSLRELAPVHVEVFDITGRSVTTLASGDVAQGRREWVWDGRDRHGRDVDPGIYIVEISGPGWRVGRSVTRLR